MYLPRQPLQFLHQLRSSIKIHRSLGLRFGGELKNFQSKNQKPEKFKKRHYHDNSDNSTSGIEDKGSRIQEVRNTTTAVVVCCRHRTPDSRVLRGENPLFSGLSVYYTGSPAFLFASFNVHGSQFNS